MRRHGATALPRAGRRLDERDRRGERAGETRQHAGALTRRSAVHRPEHPDFRVLARVDDAALHHARVQVDAGAGARHRLIAGKSGEDARLDVQIDSINLITNNRAQVRFRKRLTSNEGTQTGSFTATLLYEFRPAQMRQIDDVWRNPFGFTVTEYAVVSDRQE